MTITTNLKQLYETDDNLWLEKTIELLKQKQFNQLDLHLPFLFNFLVHTLPTT
ncbi:DUF29 family protein [Nostoc sp. UIC 10890]